MDRQPNAGNSGGDMTRGDYVSRAARCAAWLDTTIGMIVADITLAPKAAAYRAGSAPADQRCVAAADARRRPLPHPAARVRAVGGASPVSVPRFIRIIFVGAYWPFADVRAACAG